MNKKIIFLDRDGVINEEKNYLHRIEDFIFIDGVFESLKLLQNFGYQFIVVTNQSGIGRGMYSSEDYLLIDKWMKKEFEKNGVNILHSIHCPHTPEQNCNCRKPKPGMFEECLSMFQISKKDSWVIGDSERDIEAGVRAGLKNTILVRSGHQIDEKNTRADFILDSIKGIAELIMT